MAFTTKKMQTSDNLEKRTNNTIKSIRKRPTSTMAIRIKNSKSKLRATQQFISHGRKKNAWN